MRKKGLLLSVLLVVAMVFGPIQANAAGKGEIFGAKDKAMTITSLNNNEFVIDNEGSATKLYLGIAVESGTVTEYTTTLKFNNSNFTYRATTTESGWTKTETKNEDGSVTLTFKNANGISTGKHLVATVSLRVDSAAPSTDKCTITLSTDEAPDTPVPATTPKCKVEDGIYYDADGEEVTKEEYEKSCSATNPETGAFLPVAVIGLGLAVVVGLFFATKNNKMYQV